MARGLGPWLAVEPPESCFIEIEENEREETEVTRPPEGKFLLYLSILHSNQRY